MYPPRASGPASVRDRTSEFQQIVTRLQQQQPGLPSSRPNPIENGGMCSSTNRQTRFVNLQVLTSKRIVKIIGRSPLVISLFFFFLILYLIFFRRPVHFRQPIRVCKTSFKDWHGHPQHIDKTPKTRPTRQTNIHV